MERIKHGRKSRDSQLAKAFRVYKLANENWSQDELAAAFAKFKDAALGGVKPAYRILAQFYQLGHGTARNKVRALWWFRRAIEMGDEDAHLAIAEIYLRKRNGRNRALRHLEMARTAKGATERTKEDSATHEDR